MATDILGLMFCRNTWKVRNSPLILSTLMNKKKKTKKGFIPDFKNANIV